MKKLYFLAVMAVLSIASVKAINPYTPPEFVDEEWTYLGEGVYTAGIWDYFSTEYPYDLPARVYSNNANPNHYWVEPDGSNLEPFDQSEGDEWLQVTAPFIIYADDAEKVWTSPIWTMHPLIFCAYQQVPEVLGMQGSPAFYGKKNDHLIYFPANSYVIATFPTGAPITNLKGQFSVTLPDPAGVESVAVEAEAPAEFYTLQGVKVSEPMRGNVYIVKTGNKAKKVIF